MRAGGRNAHGGHATNGGQTRQAAGAVVGSGSVAHPTLARPRHARGGGEPNASSTVLPMALFSQPVFINLPTTDTERIREFWTSLGAQAIEDFSDENSVCIELTESTFAMYLSPGYYTDFIGDREIADCMTTNSALMALTVGDAAAVDALADRAIEAGAAEVPLPVDLREEMVDSGMHSREIVDPDGHQWEFVTA